MKVLSVRATSHAANVWTLTKLKRAVNRVGGAMVDATMAHLLAHEWAMCAQPNIFLELLWPALWGEYISIIDDFRIF